MIYSKIAPILTYHRFHLTCQYIKIYNYSNMLWIYHRFDIFFTAESLNAQRILFISEKRIQLAFQFFKTDAEITHHCAHDVAGTLDFCDQPSNLPSANLGPIGFTKVLGSVLGMLIQIVVEFLAGGPGGLNFQVLPGEVVGQVPGKHMFLGHRYRTGVLSPNNRFFDAVVAFRFPGNHESRPHVNAVCPQRQGGQDTAATRSAPLTQFMGTWMMGYRIPSSSQIRFLPIRSSLSPLCRPVHPANQRPPAKPGERRMPLERTGGHALLTAADL